jgi:hypothetical protein
MAQYDTIQGSRDIPNSNIRLSVQSDTTSGSQVITDSSVYNVTINNDRQLIHDSVEVPPIDVTSSINLTPTVPFSGADNTSTTDAVPTMTGYTTPTGEVSASHEYSSNSAWYAANDSGYPWSTAWLVYGVDYGGSIPYPISWQYQFGDGTKLINKYTISSADSSGFHPPTAWNLYGSNNGIDYVLLDSQSGISLGTSETGTYTFATATKYSYYKFDFTAGDTEWLAVSEIELIEETNLTGWLEIPIVPSISYDGADNTSTTDAVPVMTSNTTPEGIASASLDINNPWQAFDNNLGTWWYSNFGETSGWIQYQFTSPKVINKYTLYDAGAYMPKDWTLQGSNNGVDWDILDTVSEYTDWTGGYHTFTFVVNQLYSYFRFDITESNSSRLRLADIQLIEYDAELTANPSLYRVGENGSDFRIRTWLNVPDETPISGATILSLGGTDSDWNTTSGREWELGLSASGALVLNYNDNGTMSTVSTLTGAVTAGEWSWIEVSQTEGGIHMFVDGTDRVVAELDGADNASTTDAVPDMTSNTSPTGVVFASTNPTDAWKVFDDDTGTIWSGAYQVWAYTLGYQFTSPKLINKYTIQSGTSPNASPKSWTFQGSNNGSDWDTLDTQTNITDWSNFLIKTFTFTVNSDQTYTYFRLNVSENGGNNLSIILEIKLIEQALPSPLADAITISSVSILDSLLVGSGHPVPSQLPEADTYINDVRIEPVAGNTTSYNRPTALLEDWIDIDHKIVDYDTVATVPEIDFLIDEEPKMMTLTRTVSGDDISIGDVVILNDNGTIDHCGNLPNTISDPVSAGVTTGTQRGFSVFDPVSERTILIWEDDTAWKACTATVSGGEIITGIVNSFASASFPQPVTAVYDPDNDKIVVVYSTFSGGSIHYLKGCDVIPHATDPSQDSLSFGSAQLLVNSGSGYSQCSLAYDPTGNVILASVTTTTTSKTYVIEYDGTTFTIGNSYNFYGSSNGEACRSVYEPVNDRLVVLYSASSSIYGTIGTVTTTGAPSASSISFGTPVLLTNNTDTHPYSIDMIGIPSGKVVTWHYDQQDDANVRIGTIDDTTISWGTEYDIIPGNSTYGHGKLSYDSENDVVVAVTGKLGGGQFITDLMIDGATATIIESNEVTSDFGYVIALTYDSVTGYHIIGSISDSPSYQAYYRAYKVILSNATSDNVLGTAQTSGAIGEECIIGRYGFIDENQTGLTPGKDYYVDWEGNLTTTVTNNVYIGFSVSSTQLIVKA